MLRNPAVSYLTPGGTVENRRPYWAAMYNTPHEAVSPLDPCFHHEHATDPQAIDHSRLARHCESVHQVCSVRLKHPPECGQDLDKLCRPSLGVRSSSYGWARSDRITERHIRRYDVYERYRSLIERCVSYCFHIA